MSVLTYQGKYVKRGGKFATIESWSSYWATLLASPNSDIVQWNSIDTISTTTPFAQASADPDAKQGIIMWVKHRNERMTGSAIITQIKLHNKTKINIATIVFGVWRWNGTTYDQIYTEDITAKVSSNDEIQTIHLASDVNVQEGDHTGSFYKSTTGSVDVVGIVATTGVGIKYKTNMDYDTTPYNWASLGTNLKFSQPIHCYGTAPMIIGIGDSIISSGILHYGMLDLVNTAFDTAKSWLYKLYNSDARFTYQNCGIGGNTITQIEARFNRDVILKKPKLVVINGGINDIATGTTKTVFLTKWTSILDMCKAAGIIPIVWKIMPWTAGTTLQLQTRDDWNIALEALFNTYIIKGKKIIDWGADLGVFRAGGDVGNLWDLQATYNGGDGVHLSEAGNAKVASTVLALFS